MARVPYLRYDPSLVHINPDEVKRKITRNTKAILAVNLFGLPADYGSLRSIAKKYGLTLIEDAAQSINADYKNRKSGNLADISCFSLYATKNIMCGEGGIVTNKQRPHPG
jgi:dTDP-4-amino-4,6-dideoxygalactose transaminase